LITNGAGASIAQHDYTPFGVEDPAQSEEIRKFTGHERDLIPEGQPDAGRYLDYMHARYYDPHEARFLSVDPRLDFETAPHDPQRWNRYAYVANNPMNRADPTGEILTILGGYRTIQSIAGDAVGRVSLNEDGTLDVSQLTNEDLVGNEGALLLWEMARSDKAYTYDEGKTIDTAAGPQPVDGVANLDQKSVDLYGRAVPPQRWPVGEVDGAVVVDPTQHWFDAGTGTMSVPIPAVALHELGEAYAKVERNQFRGPDNGPGGHWDARQREMTLMDQRRYWTQYPAGGVVKRLP
jgi:RHS repeat-associated protein